MGEGERVKGICRKERKRRTAHFHPPGLRSFLHFILLLPCRCNTQSQFSFLLLLHAAIGVEMAFLDEELDRFFGSVVFGRFFVLEKRVSTAEGGVVVGDFKLVGEVGHVVGVFGEGGAVGGGGGVGIEF